MSEKGLKDVALRLRLYICELDKICLISKVSPYFESKVSFLDTYRPCQICFVLLLILRIKET